MGCEVEAPSPEVVWPHPAISWLPQRLTSTHNCSRSQLGRMVQTAGGVSQLRYSLTASWTESWYFCPVQKRLALKAYRLSIICERLCESNKDRDLAIPGLVSHETFFRPVSRSTTTRSYSISAPCSTTPSDAGPHGGSAGGKVLLSECVALPCLRWTR